MVPRAATHRLEFRVAAAQALLSSTSSSPSLLSSLPESTAMAAQGEELATEAARAYFSAFCRCRFKLVLLPAGACFASAALTKAASACIPGWLFGGGGTESSTFAGGGPGAGPAGGSGGGGDG